MSTFLRCCSVGVIFVSSISAIQLRNASAQGVKNPGPPLVEEDQEQILSYWTAAGGWHSELQLRNNLPVQDLTVTPVIRSADGSEVPLPPTTIKPQEVQSIDLGVALNTYAPQLIGGFGSVALRYRASDNRNLYAAIMVHDTGHPIAFHIDASGESAAYDAGSREGIWWLPSESAKDILVLTNQGKRPLEVVLSISDASGKEVREQLSLSPRQTSLYSVRQFVNSGHLAGSYGGIRVRALNHGGSLDTLHAVYDETAGFSALLKMFDREPSASVESRDFARTGLWTLRAPMLALSYPDPSLNFPAGTVLQPQIFIRNAADRRVTANLRFVWRKGEVTGKAAGPKVVLRPNETRRIDVGALQNGGPLPLDAQWASVILTSDGPPDDLSAVTASYDATLRYGAQTPFSDQLASKWAGGQWEVDSMHDSIITAGNGGTKADTAEFTIFYNRGQNHYDMEKTLQPDEQMWINVGKLIRDQIPDKNGKTLPSDLTSGSYRFRDLTSPAVGSLFEGKVIYDKSFGHVAYGCAACCAQRAPYLTYNPFFTMMGPGLTNGVEAADTCGGIDDLSIDFYNWNTANQAVATTTKAGTHTGISIGSTTSSTSGYKLTTNGRNGCYETPAAPSGPTDVVPKVTFDPTFSGIAQGSNQNVNVTLSGASTSSTPITLTLKTTSGTGVAIFVSGGTIASGGASTQISSNTQLIIKGVTSSSTAGNIKLDATIPNEGTATEDATNPFTFSVVSVSLSLQTSGPPTLGNVNFPFANLGVQVDYGYPPGYSSCPAAFQVTGAVTPSNYPGPIFLRRTVLGGMAYQDPGSTVVATVTQKDDTSDPTLETQSGGKIYDLDAPAEAFKNMPVGDTIRYRLNFDEYAVLGTSTSTTKVSAQDLNFFIRTSCRLASSTSVVLDTTYAGDNQIGAGSTKTSDNLQ